MPKFRKRPSEVFEAVQWYKMGDHERVVMRTGEPMVYGKYGWQVVTPGYWIVPDGVGHKPWRPSIFEATYEPVTEGK